MYEKPQYFTKDGFKRLSQNPYAGLNASQRLKLLKKKTPAASLQRSMNKKDNAVISDKAAACIAKVLKEMLNSRH